MPITKEIKKTFSSSIVELYKNLGILRILERCGKARAEGESFSHISSVLKKFPSA